MNDIAMWQWTDKVKDRKWIRENWHCRSFLGMRSCLIKENVEQLGALEWVIKSCYKRSWKKMTQPLNVHHISSWLMTKLPLSTSDLRVLEIDPSSMHLAVQSLRPFTSSHHSNLHLSNHNLSSKPQCNRVCCTLSVWPLSRTLVNSK